MLSQEFSIDPLTVSPGKFNELYKNYAVPEQDTWRIPLLGTLLDQRYEMAACGDDVETVSGLLESLCST